MTLFPSFCGPSIAADEGKFGGLIAIEVELKVGKINYFEPKYFDAP